MRYVAGPEVELSKLYKFIFQFDFNIFLVTDIICITSLWGKTLNFNLYLRALPENLIFPNYQCRQIIFLQAVEISANWFSSIKMQLNNLILLRQRREEKERRREKWIEIINCTWNHCWNVFLSFLQVFSLHFPLLNDNRKVNSNKNKKA